MTEERIELGKGNILTLRNGVPYSFQKKNEACLMLSKFSAKDWFTRSYVESNGIEEHYCVNYEEDGKYYWQHNGFEPKHMQFYPIGAEMQYLLGHAFVSFLLGKESGTGDKRQLLHCVLEDLNEVLMTIDSEGKREIWMFNRDQFPSHRSYGWQTVDSKRFLVPAGNGFVDSYDVVETDGIFTLQKNVPC